MLGSLRRRVMRTLLPAVLGGTFGLAYARYTLPPEIFASSSLPAMFGACGAAAAILAVRLTSILRLLIGELRANRGKTPPPDDEA